MDAQEQAKKAMMKALRKIGYKTEAQWIRDMGAADETTLRSVMLPLLLDNASDRDSVLKLRAAVDRAMNSDWYGVLGALDAENQ